MTKIATFLILLACLAAVCLAQGRINIDKVQRISSPEELNEWITYYYEHPRSDLAKSALLLSASEGFLAAAKTETPSVYFIFEEVLRANPSLKNDYLSVAGEGSSDVKQAVAFALWESRLGTPSEIDSLSTQETAAYIASLKDQQPIDLLATDQISPTILDGFWAAFFVTGDDRYVARVAEFVPWIEEKNDVRKLLVGGAARWSLTSNAIQHPKVLAATKRLAKEANGRRKELLEQVVKDAERKRTS